MEKKENLILYVDDEHANRVVFRQAFGAKHRVQCVQSGAEAVEILKGGEVAVLITDQRMPGMSGDELLALAKVISPDSLRMILTAYSDLEPILKAVNEGLVVRYIIKPWNRAELEEILSWALQMYELSRVNSAIQVRLIQTERLLTLGQLAGSVIHDLVQPLSAMSMNTELLEEYSAIAPQIAELARSGTEVGLVEPDTRDRIVELADALPVMSQELRAGVTFLSTLLSQLSEYQRWGVRTVENRDIDPVPVVRLAVSLCREGAVVGRCRTTNETPKDLPRVRAAMPELLQIFLNLVRNAQQAIEEGGKGGTVVVSAVDQPNDVRFAVRDDGQGMTPELLAKASTPFFTTRKDGTGLGLAQVRRLVGSLGGTFNIDTAPEKGTTVSFTIPKVAPAGGAASRGD